MVVNPIYDVARNTYNVLISRMRSEWEREKEKEKERERERGRERKKNIRCLENESLTFNSGYVQQTNQ